MTFDQTEDDLGSSVCMAEDAASLGTKMPECIQQKQQERLMTKDEQVRPTSNKHLSCVRDAKCPNDPSMMDYYDP